MGTHKGQTKKRPCLRCDKYFYGNTENRICSECKDSPQYQNATGSVAVQKDFARDTHFEELSVF